MTTGNDYLEVQYDLFELPTAQHKAGLAGLILLVETMRDREMGPLPELNVSQTHASFRWSRESLQAVFNEWYAPILVEIGKENDKRTEVRPRGDFFSHWLGDGCEAWLKLWRDLVWGILRTQPRARLAYKDRLENENSSFIEKIWLNLHKKAFEKSQIASALFIGANETNAEYVPFLGDAKDTLLLHFWQLASLVFVPQEINPKNGTKTSAGYLVVVPEPCDLIEFCGEMREVIQRLEPKTVGFRPQGALIDVPAEGGLEYLYQLAKFHLQNKELKYSLSSVEFFHLEKRGNNVRLLTSEKIVARRSLLERYETIRRLIFNPLFKTLVLRNLLRNTPWYENGDELFHAFPLHFFVFSSDSPLKSAFFGRDAIKFFQQIKSKEEPMTEQNRDDHLVICIYRLIKTYVKERSEDKSKIKLDSIPRNEKGHGQYPREYREAVERVCGDAFLAMRSRREQDFIEYFIGVICAVPQRLPESDFLLVTKTLLDDPDRVKTVSMMALSAHSYVPGTETNNQKGDDA